MRPGDSPGCGVRKDRDGTPRPRRAVELADPPADPVPRRPVKNGIASLFSRAEQDNRRDGQGGGEDQKQNAGGSHLDRT